ncbi:MAG: multiheme c-type cytochrome [Candidatus Hodarchaeales archaeon]
MKNKLFVFLLFAVVLTGYGNMAIASNPEDAGCLKCHEGIENISEIPDSEMAALSCIDCHKGNAKGETAEDAHKGMYANPSDFRVVDQICGECHEDIVGHSKKSMHATMAGMISGTRFPWAAQDTRDAIYATYALEDKDGDVPVNKGALKSLKQIPVYDPSKPMSNTNHPADDYLKDQCLRCHLWSSGHERDGDYRGSGCVACHMVYSDNGTYEGGDKAIPKDQKDRPKMHRITNKIPEYQCIHCHNRGGRTGVSFIGTMESDGYGSPWSTEAGKKGGKKLHGKYYNHLTADVHFQKGMTCIDCHTALDMHGDGNIYNKKWQAVEIECEDCHGTTDSYSNLTSSWGNPLTNLMKKDSKIILTSKMDGKERVIPQTKDAVTKGSMLAQTAMGIKSHMDKMECYTCHAKWTPQCYGCHAQQNLAKKSSGWIYTKEPEDISKAGTKANRGSSTFQWKETRSYLRWETPVLGINSEGKVSPFIPGCQAIVTQIGADGKPILHNKVFTTSEGISGISQNPIQPHTISTEARTCEDCHASRKAIGLGTGIYNTKANGVDLPFELERIVDENGKQLQTTNHDGARPFNKEEQERIMRVNTCIACHKDNADAALWKKVTDVTGFAKTDKKHKEILEKVFDKAVK